MKTKKTIIFLVTGVLAVTMAFGAVAYRSALAATSTATSTGTTSTTTPSNQAWMGGSGPNGGYSDQDLATALGITTDALNTAYQTAYSATHKQAVSDGLITQAQADQLTTNGAVFPFGNH